MIGDLFFSMIKLHSSSYKNISILINLGNTQSPKLMENVLRVIKNKKRL